MIKIAIVVSQFNKHVTDSLKNAAIQYFREQDIHIQDADIYSVPGAFEIPVVAQALAHSKKYDGITCLGCVIKGDTAHFEFISLGATLGILQSMLATQTPMSFGVLTTYDDDQALARSMNNSENKGREAAQACFETIQLLRKIKN